MIGRPSPQACGPISPTERRHDQHDTLGPLARPNTPLLGARQLRVLPASWPNPFQHVPLATSPAGARYQCPDGLTRTLHQTSIGVLQHRRATLSRPAKRLPVRRVTGGALFFDSACPTGLRP